MIQRKPTFSDYVGVKQMKDYAKKREADTTARALDLEVADFGAEFLQSRMAEVMLGRLMSVVMASKMCDFKLSENLKGSWKNGEKSLEGS